MAGRGAELAFGRTLPRLLREAGLVAVEADAYFPITSPACIDLEIATVQQIRERFLAAGLGPRRKSTSTWPTSRAGSSISRPPLISTWGRKPYQP